MVRRADDDGDDGAADGLTPAGREEWRNFRNEFDATRAAELHRKRCRKRDVLDLDDVTEVRRAVLLSMSETVTRGGRTRPVGAGLIAVGSVGVASMAGFLHSGLQIGVFTVLVLIGLVGVVLACLSGGDPPGA